MWIVWVWLSIKKWRRYCLVCTIMVDWVLFDQIAADYASKEYNDFAVVVQPFFSEAVAAQFPISLLSTVSILVLHSASCGLWCILCSLTASIHLCRPTREWPELCGTTWSHQRQRRRPRSHSMNLSNVPPTQLSSTPTKFNLQSMLFMGLCIVLPNLTSLCWLSKCCC